MLSNTVKNMVIERLTEDEDLHEAAGAYYRSPNEFHSSMKKVKQRADDLEHHIERTTSTATMMQARTDRNKLNQLYSDSDALVNAANNHHGDGVGDAIRDHAHMSLEPRGEDGTDTYNLPHNVEFRKTYGIKTDLHLSPKPPKEPKAPPTPKEPKPKKEPTKKPSISYTRKHLKDTALLKIFDFIKSKLPNKSEQ